MVQLFELIVSIVRNTFMYHTNIRIVSDDLFYCLKIYSIIFVKDINNYIYHLSDATDDRRVIDTLYSDGIIILIIIHGESCCSGILCIHVIHKCWIRLITSNIRILKKTFFHYLVRSRNTKYFLIFRYTY